MNTNTYLLPQTTDPTNQSYSRVLRYFFVRMQNSPELVTSAEVMGFCFGKGLSGREPAAITIGSRIATISSFYRFRDRTSREIYRGVKQRRLSRSLRL